MNLIFAGTPEFAAQALSALLEAGHRVPLVLTQPDRPAGRGMKLAHSPVKVVAMEHGLRVEQPPSLKGLDAQRMLAEATRNYSIETFVVAAYGLILPQAVLDLPPRGCLNIHASLLPRWRGAAPIQRAIEAGDRETGVCIMLMEAGLDTGPVLLERRLPILEEDNGGSLHNKLAVLGASSIVETLARIDALTPAPQSGTGVTYAHKLAKADGEVDFNRPARELERQIRAFDPYPGASAALGPEICKLWSAQCIGHLRSAVHRPGEIIAAKPDGIDVACGEGVLRITELQKPGGKRLKVRDFLAGKPLQPGLLFTSIAAPTNRF